MKPVKRSKLFVARFASMVTITTALSACQSEQGLSSKDNPSLSMSAPHKVLQVRAVDKTQLRPVVRLDQNTTITMLDNGGDQWSGTINVSTNSQHDIQIEWVETVDGKALTLAKWSDTLFVDNDGLTVTINAREYDYSLDFDGDSSTNLEERQNNTDPFNAEQDGITGNQNNANTDTNTETSSGVNNSDDSNASADNSDANTHNEDTNAPNESGSSSESNSGSNDNVLVQAQVIIPRISANAAPTLDGIGAELNNGGVLVNEWAGAVQTDIYGKALSLSNLMIDHSADSSNGATLRNWAAIHDNEYLYVLVLSDDVGARKSDSTQSWNDDSVELFLDADNSKLDAWGDSDDYHVLIPLLKLNNSDPNNQADGRVAFGPGSATEGLDLQFSTGPGVGPDGIRVKKWEQDVYEIRVKLSSVGIEPGVPFGFELQINDDDSGGARDSKWGWFHPARQSQNTDTTYLNPSIMGTIELAP